MAKKSVMNKPDTVNVGGTIRFLWILPAAIFAMLIFSMWNAGVDFGLLLQQLSDHANQSLKDFFN